MADALQLMREQVSKELNGSVTIVVLGASGDLAKKKTFPALFGLYRSKLLPAHTRIVGYARSQMTHDDFLQRVTQYIKVEGDDEELKLFKTRLTYLSGSYDAPEGFQALNEQMLAWEESVSHRVFYMALPPSVFVPVATNLKQHAYAASGTNRIIVEKPFGKDLASSRALGASLGQLFAESEIYRIDHYLGKEMVKNVMTMRFANIFFSQIWNRMHVDNVQITFKEPFGTEGRGGYFDEFGIIRDVMQNHLLQVLTLIAMEPPISTDSEAIRDEKVKVLRCIPPISLEDTLLGQYVGNDKGKPGYLEDDSLQNKQSKTPTFAATVLWVQNERWEGVPFILKAGKALDTAKVEVRIQFRNVAGNIYRGAARNEMVLRVQPNEAVYMKFNNKLPGLSYQTIQTELDLSYKERYTDLHIPDAYESLILDVLRNDHSNFVRHDELDASWKIFTPLLHQIDDPSSTLDIHSYIYGSRGPDALDAFVRRYGYDRSTMHYEWPVQSVKRQA